jgi:dTDP-4-amino-4,6-dideoxygalactose transaminase
MAGAAAPVGALSFFPTKNLGAFGDGGMVTARDPDLAETVRKLRVHGGRQMYRHELVGTNSRLDALQAAVLRAKLPHLEAWTVARRAHACAYGELFEGLGPVRTPGVAEGNFHVYNQYTLRVERRDELRRFLSDRGVGTGVYYPVPLHLQPCFAELGYREGDLPVSEALCREVLSLPVFPELSDEGRSEVAAGVRAFYGASS